MQNKYACECDCERDVQVAMPQAASSMGAGKQARRETALVSSNVLDGTLTCHIRDTCALF